MATVGELKATITADTSQAERAFKQFGDTADQQAKRAEGASKLIAGLGGVAVAGIAAAGAAAAASVVSFANFEKTVSSIGAVSGASQAELQQLSATALQLGKDTSFSASAAAEGMAELAKAGVSTADIVNGAAKAALDLAAAGGVSVGEAAGIAANAMQIFGKDASQLAAVGDRIAGFANATSGGVNDFRFSLSAAGSVAAMVGMSFEDTAAAITAMGKAGILGSDAGTSLKTMLTNLTPKTQAAQAAFQELGLIVNDQNVFFDESTGKLKSLEQIAGILNTQLGDLGEEDKLQALYKLFGSDAIRAGSILMKQGAEGIAAINEELTKVSAADVANARLDNLSGSFERMTGSAETLAIQLGAQLAPGIRVAVDEVTNFLNAMLESDAVAQFAEAVGQTLGQAVQVGIAALRTITAAVTNLFGVLTSTGGDRAGFLAALGLTPELAEQAGAILDRVQTIFGYFVEDVSRTLQDIGDLLGGFTSFDDFVALMRSNFGYLSQDVEESVSLVGDAVGGVVRFIADQAAPLAESLLAWGAAFVEWVQPMVGPMLEQLGGLVASAVGWIADQVGPLLEQLGAWGRQFVAWVQPQIEPMLGALGGLIVAGVNWIAGQIPGIVAALVGWGTAFVEWVAPKIPGLLVELGSLLLQMNAWVFGTALPAIVRQLLEWGKAFVEWVIPRIPELIGKLGEMNVRLGQWIVGEALPAIVRQLIEWGKAFVEWVKEVWPKLSGELGRLSGQLMGWIGEQAQKAGPAARAIGVAIADGMTGGIFSKAASVANAAAKMAKDAIDAAKSALGVQSPSLVFQHIGQDTVSGFVIGVKDEAGNAVKAVAELFDDVVAQGKEAAKQAGAAIAASFADSLNASIAAANAAGAVNIDKLLPGKPSTPPGNGQNAYNALTASYAGTFAGMGGQDIIAYLSARGLNPSGIIGPYLQGLTDLATFQQQAAQWFSAAMASGLWSPQTGWRQPISGVDSPFDKDPVLSDGSGGGDKAKATHLARGGIAWRPTYAMIGEPGTGGEAVSPLRDLVGYIDDAVDAAFGRRELAMAGAPIVIHSTLEVDREVLARKVQHINRDSLRRTY